MREATLTTRSRITYRPGSRSLPPLHTPFIHTLRVVVGRDAALTHAHTLPHTPFTPPLTWVSVSMFILTTPYPMASRISARLDPLHGGKVWGWFEV